MTNSGNMNVQSGTLVLEGGLTNFSGTTLEDGGSYDLQGVLVIPGADIVTNAAQIELNGPGAAIVGVSSSNALANLALNSGGLDLQDGADLTLLGCLANTGEVEIGLDGALVATEYDQVLNSASTSRRWQTGGDWWHRHQCR